MIASMNILNLVQNLLIVSMPCARHAVLNDILLSDCRVTGRMHDSCATSREWPTGSQSFRALCRILGSSKPNHLRQSDIP